MEEFGAIKIISYRVWKRERTCCGIFPVSDLHSIDSCSRMAWQLNLWYNLPNMHNVMNCESDVFEAMLSVEVQSFIQWVSPLELSV